MALVFLCGLKDCGKTTILNSLKNSHKINGFDLDEEILVKSKETSIRALFSRIREKEFRLMEFNTLKSIIDSEKLHNCVIALGGGSCDSKGLLEECREKGQLVYLYQNPNILYSRMEAEGLPSFVKDRPCFDSLFKERDEKYAKTCSVKIDLTSQSMEKVCQTLLEMYLN